MPKQPLDPRLLKKLQKATGGKPLDYIRQQVSKKASKASISSLAAQIVWAQAKGIGVAHALNRASSEVRGEVRSAQGGAAPGRVSRAVPQPLHPRSRKSDAISASVIDSIIQDKTLRERCKNLLQGKKHFDQVFREATTVLDDRLKAKTGIRKMKPLDLVGRAVNPDPQKAIIEVSSDRDEQEGFYSICKGTMLFFRNRAHHGLSDTFTREEALEFCGFIDTILGVIEQSQIHLGRF